MKEVLKFYFIRVYCSTVSGSHNCQKFCKNFVIVVISDALLFDAVYHIIMETDMIVVNENCRRLLLVSDEI